MSDDEPAESARPDESAVETTITITVEDGLRIAEDDETGISSQGPTKIDALRNLAATLETVEKGDADDGDWL